MRWTFPSENSVWYGLIHYCVNCMLGTVKYSFSKHAHNEPALAANKGNFILLSLKTFNYGN